MHRVNHQIPILSRRRNAPVASQPCSFDRSYSQPLTAMATATRVLPKLSNRGILDVPSSAFNAVRLAAEEMGVTLRVHDHHIPGAFHGEDFVPVPHLLLELSAEHAFQVARCIDVIDPQIETIVDAHMKPFAVPQEQ